MTDDASDSYANIEMTAELVAAYVSRNSVPVAELPNLIRSIHGSLTTLGTVAAPEGPSEPLKPAVPVKKSITDDYIVSLEDGRKFKSMKRYLAGLGMTPADYRAKWGLPSDYPMVAPAYAAKRSELARSSGLGRKASDAPAPAPEAAEAPPTPDVEAAPPADAAGKKPRKRAPKAS